MTDESSDASSMNMRINPDGESTILIERLVH